MHIKRVVILNSFDFGSTGSICKGIKRTLESHGIDTYFFCETWKYKKDETRSIYLGTRIGNYLSSKLERVGAFRNIFNYINTLKFIREIKKIKPDIINVHNLHNNYIDLKTLFSFFKKSNICIIWTLHDCWGFTGRCPHFLLTGCSKWENGCNKCPYPRNLYPYSYFDYTKKMWRIKKEMFGNLDNLLLVTPSEWLFELLKKSFLSKHPSIVLNNGIDLSIFRPRRINIHKQLGIPPNHFVLLGVSFGWNYSKGIDRFNALADVLPENFNIVLVGASSSEKKIISSKIIVVQRTKSKEELAKIYSSSDLFINPTREDNFPTVNIESLACGTPVLTSNIGGCPEIIDENCGISMDFNDIEAVKERIIDICENHLFSSEDCLKRALFFNEKKKFEEYYNLFQHLNDSNKDK